MQWEKALQFLEEKLAIKIETIDILNVIELKRLHFLLNVVNEIKINGRSDYLLCDIEPSELNNLFSDLIDNKNLNTDNGNANGGTYNFY